MNNKGFTLVELLAVIAILALLVLISVPMITRYVKNAQEFSNETVLKNAEDAALNYADQNSKRLATDPKSTFISNGCAINYTLDSSNYTRIASNCRKVVSIKTLIDEGYFKDSANKLKENGEVIIYKFKGNKKTNSECANSNQDSCYNFELKAYADKNLLK